MHQTHTHELTFTGAEVRKRFVSWAHGEADREWMMLTLLAEHSPGLAPLPLSRAHTDGAPVIVMERLPGHPLGDGPLSADQTHQLARALRRLWAVPVGAARARGVRERHNGPAVQVSLVVESLGAPYDVRRCQEPALVRRAVDATLAWLADGDLPEPQLTAVGIADLNPANALWDGSRCRLVDFEEGGLTDPAYEMADHIEHLAMRGVLEPEALLDALEPTDDEWERAVNYRPLAAAFWLATLLPGNGGWHRNPPGTTEAQAERLLTLLP